MNKMQISMLVTDAFTQEVYIDNTVEVVSDTRTMWANAEVFSQTWPNSYVSFTADNGDFVYLMPLNQAVDEKRMDIGLMTWDEYMSKWY